MKNTKLALTFICLTAFTPMTFAAVKLTDAEIAKIVETANDTEIDAAQIAESKGTSPEVKAFAKNMAKVHDDSNKEAQEWSKAKKVTPKDSDTSRAMKDDAKKKISALDKANAKDFDHAYMKDQVEAHEKVLNAIDTELLPNAQDPALKAMLEKTRPVVEQHLAHARGVLKTMPGETKRSR